MWSMHAQMQQVHNSLIPTTECSTTTTTAVEPCRYMLTASQHIEMAMDGSFDMAMLCLQYEYVYICNIVQSRLTSKCVAVLYTPYKAV